MPAGGHRHEHHGEHAEDDRLDQADEEFEHHHHRGQEDGQQRAHHQQQDGTRHDIAEQPEGERDHLHDLRDPFKNTHQEIDRPEKRLGEKRAGVEELGEILAALGAETDHLGHHHRDQRQHEGEVQVGGGCAHEGHHLVSHPRGVGGCYQAGHP